MTKLNWVPILLLSAIIGVGTCGSAQDGGAPTPSHAIYPNPSLTPGATNPNVSQDNIQQTICVKGFTKTIRPPVSVTNQIKKQQMLAYHDRSRQSPALPMKGRTADTSKCVDHSNDARCYELDHLISLELGGCPDCVTNLWPQPYSPKPGAHEKDKVENFLHNQVCSGAMTLQEAQRQIVQDWYKVYRDNHLQ